MQFTKDRQRGWKHYNEMFDNVFFHTYEQLVLPNHPPRTVHILLPSEYAQSSERYPVIYCNDGHRAFWSEGPRDRCWEIQHKLSSFYRENRTRKVLFVAVVPIDRDIEYTHCKALLPQGEDWEDTNDYEFPGGLADYSKFMGDLKDWIDKNYRTIPDPQSTTIMGASHGGTASFYISTHLPEKFGIAGVYSGSLWLAVDSPLVLFDNQGFSPNPITSIRQSKLLKDVSQVIEQGRVRFWFTWGLKRDGGEHNSTLERLSCERTKELIEALKDSPYNLKENVNYFYCEDPHGGHEDPSWSYQFEVFMQTFYQN